MTLNVGDKAPEFSLPATTGETISLKDQAGKKVVLYFYPADDTPGCTIEACGFRDSLDQLDVAGAVILGVSADSMESHDRFLTKFDLNFPLLSDEDKTVANAYGAWGEKQRFGKTVIGMRRETFLIDEQGDIQKIWRQVKPEGHPEQVLAVILGDKGASWLGHRPGHPSWTKLPSSSTSGQPVTRPERPLMLRLSLFSVT